MLPHDPLAIGSVERNAPSSIASLGGHPRSAHSACAEGGLVGLLGWLTQHFSVTYAKPDPFPYTNRQVRPGSATARIPS